jgi:hypothetical protein
MFSPIYHLLMNPSCSFEMNLGSMLLSVMYIIVVRILYVMLHEMIDLNLSKEVGFYSLGTRATKEELILPHSLFLFLDVL